MPSLCSLISPAFSLVLLSHSLNGREKKHSRLQNFFSSKFTPLELLIRIEAFLKNVPRKYFQTFSQHGMNFSFWDDVIYENCSAGDYDELTTTTTTSLFRKKRRYTSLSVDKYVHSTNFVTWLIRKSANQALEFAVLL